MWRWIFLALVAGVLAATANPRGAASTWPPDEFKSLVAFGDSYTDESRIAYWVTSNGSAPPTGWTAPESDTTSTGGRIWARYVSQYSGAQLYDYAVSGAVCSNNISPRIWDYTNAPFPAVAEYEVPAYLADVNYSYPNGTNFLHVPPSSTVYSMWIGPNDLGNDAFLTDSQINGKTLVDYLDCVYAQLDKLYEAGARFFVLMNVIALQLTPQYALPSAGGKRATKFWKNKGANTTEISFRMMEQVVLVNDAFKHRTPYDVVIKGRYSGAHFAVMDTYGLIEDIYYHPEQYLNGTAPLNVTGTVNSCDVNGTICTVDPNPDSFMWYDELHPSEQTDRVIAREFVKVVNGESKWATYWP